jgi:lysophospholipase L1-like esterase
VLSRTGARLEAIGTLNAVAAEVMAENGVTVNDLHGYVLPQAAEWQQGDKVHFNEKGNEALGKRVSGYILDALPKAP